MKSSSKLSSNPQLHDRCHHISPSGRRCSQPACPSHPTLCFTHAPKPPSPQALMAAELSEAAGSLATPSEVNHPPFQNASRLHRRPSTSQKGRHDRLPRTNNSPHSREIAFHQQLERKLHPRTIIHDLPRPDRGEVVSGPPARPLSPSDQQISATVNAAPVAPSANTPSAMQNDEQSGASPIAAPLSTEPIPLTATPPPRPDAPEKIPDLSHFYANDPTLDPRFHAYNVVNIVEDSALLTSSARVTQFIPAPYLFLRIVRRVAKVVYGRYGIVASQCRNRTATERFPWK